MRREARRRPSPRPRARAGVRSTGEGADGRRPARWRSSTTSRPRCRRGRRPGDAATASPRSSRPPARSARCVHKIQATATLKGTTPDFTGCDAKLDAAYAKAEVKAGGACPTIGDAEAICDDVQASFAEIEADIADRDTDDLLGLGPYGVGVRTVTLVDTLAADGGERHVSRRARPHARHRHLVSDGAERRRRSKSSAPDRRRPAGRSR